MVTQRILRTNMVEGRVSVIVGLIFMVRVSIPHIGTKDPLG